MDLAERRWRHDQSPFGGKATGPNPTDRGKCGTKRSVLTEGQGIPLAVVVAGANRHDMKLLADTLDAVVVERPEPTAEVPQHVCLDKGDDDDECRQVAERMRHPAYWGPGEEQREKRGIPGTVPGGGWSSRPFMVEPLS